MKFRSIFVVCLYCITISIAWGFEPFVVEDIEVEGLQRITLGTAFNYLPIKVGETLDAEKTTAAIRALYKTGFFEDVSFSRVKDTLVVYVVERPSISSITIFGNEDIGSEELLEALKSIGLTEGRVFKRSLLDQVKQELHRQYFNLGKYGVKIDSTVRKLERNRVDVEIDIKEGDAAIIKQIRIIGNKAYEDFELLDKIELTSPTLFSGMAGSEKYSKQQLVGDLEAIRSYYMDHGYINFNIESTQVSISPDKRDVFITINVKEGSQYIVQDITISGDMVIQKKELMDMIVLKTGSVFSRRKLVDSTTKITDRLGIDGYAFANVNTIPNIDKKTKEISIAFFVDPGKRVYVRRINVSGNTKTQDEVIRRELRQMEGGWLSTPLINRSKVRLQRLGFFDEVKVETPAVPGTTDQVDVNFEVVEGSTGNFTAGLGYGQEGGLLFNTSVTLNNYLGTGKRVALELNNSTINEVYSFSYRNPYYTLDGVSRSLTLFDRKTNLATVSISGFTTDVLGANVNFGLPLGEYFTVRIGGGYEKTDLRINADNSSESQQDFVVNHGNKFENYQTIASLAYDSRNRAIFPDKGLSSKVSMELTFPGSGLEYYKASFRNKFYFPIADKVSWLVGVDYSYGDGYSGTPTLPFFKNFYAGGTRSVRGFRGNTIGPGEQEIDTDGQPVSDENGDPVKGNPVGGFRKIVAKTELFFPSPFVDEPTNKFRFSVFVDAGQVYGSGPGVVSDDRIRAAYGIGAIWITPVGALTFSWAWPLKSEEGDDLERFGFNIGAPF